jgi:26S proteasome regulatory subunit N12
MTPLCRYVAPAAPQEWVFAGLNLLRLLLANRIAEFHTELELIPEQVSSRQEVQVLQLRWLQ